MHVVVDGQAPTGMCESTAPSPDAEAVVSEPNHVVAQLDKALFVLMTERRRFDTGRIAADATSWTQHLVLNAVKDRPLPMKHLARMLRQSAPAMTLSVRRMLHRGVVERVADSSDRRSVLIGITELGRVALNRSTTEMLDIIAERVHTLTDAERNHLRRALPVLLRFIGVAEKYTSEVQQLGPALPTPSSQSVQPR